MKHVLIEEDSNKQETNKQVHICQLSVRAIKKSKVQKGDRDGVESIISEEVVREVFPKKVPFGQELNEMVGIMQIAGRFQTQYS